MNSRESAPTAPGPARDAETGTATQPGGEYWRWCPRCGQELRNEHCKLKCPRCHYFMSCSDFD